MALNLVHNYSLPNTTLTDRGKYAIYWCDHLSFVNMSSIGEVVKTWNFKIDYILSFQLRNISNAIINFLWFVSIEFFFLDLIRFSSLQMNNGISPPISIEIYVT